MTPANGSLATKSLVTLVLLGFLRVAHAQGGATGDPAQPGDPKDDEIIDLPIIPVVEDQPPPEVKGDGPPALSVTYDKGIAFETADETFKAKIALRTQTRLTVNRSLADGEEFESNFSIPRLRLQIEGNVFGKDTRYKLEAGLGDAGSFSFVRDFYLEKKVGPAWLRGGMWKRPFNRQELVADFASEFNERAITARFVGGGRDLGIAIHNDYEKTPEGIEWALGVFNGFSGGDERPFTTVGCVEDPVTMLIECEVEDPKNFPDDFGPAVVAHVAYNKGKVKGYSEGDLDGGPLRFGVGLSYKIDLANLESPVGDTISHGLALDAFAKVTGFDVQVGGFLLKLLTADARFGAMIQAGYFVVPKKIQVAARGAFHQLPGTDGKLIEVRGAFNYHFNGHSWKIATDFGLTKTTGEGNDPDLQLRSMAQLTF